jgi:hypothetical protein
MNGYLNSANDITHDPGIPMDRELTCCPHCGGDTYYVRLKVTGVIRENHRFDGTRADNTGMWDDTRTRQMKTIWCADCDKPIAKVGAETSHPDMLP